MTASSKLDSVSISTGAPTNPIRFVESISILYMLVTVVVEFMLPVPLNETETSVTCGLSSHFISCVKLC